MSPAGPFVGADPDAVAVEAEHRVRTALAAAQAPARDGVARLVLAGGSTPRRLHARLAERPGGIDWHAVEVFQGDERCVPHGDGRSNASMAAATLLDPLGVPAARRHLIRSAARPGRAAAEYEHELLRAAAPRDDGTRFDLVLLGLGADGHTASLFPGGPELHERERLAVASRAPEPPVGRVTLTPPALSSARRVLLLVTGAGKAPAVARALAGEPGLPTGALHPASGAVEWLLDRDAARLSGA